MFAGAQNCLYPSQPPDETQLCSPDWEGEIGCSDAALSLSITINPLWIAREELLESNKE